MIGLKVGQPQLRWIIITLIASFLSAASANALYPSPTQTKGNTVADEQAWNLKDVEIRHVIRQVAKITGKNFIVDPRVKGKVTMISSEPLSEDELYRTFLIMLNVYGYAAIEEGQSTKIVPNALGKTQAKLLQRSQRYSADSNYVVSVLNVRYVSANDLVAALKPLIGQESYIGAYAQSNDVILASTNSDAQRIAQMIHAVDRPIAEKGVDVVYLRHAEPTELANILTTLLSNKSNLQSTGIKLAPDERTRSILINGSAKERMQIRALIAQIDQPSKDIDETTQVLYLKFVRAKDIAPILANIILDYEAKLKQESAEQPVNPVSPAADALSERSSSSSEASTGQSSLSQRTSQNLNLARDLDNRQRSGAVATSVQWEETTNSVILRAPSELMRILKKVITKLDIRRPQVLVEVIIAEVNLERARDLGVEWNTGGSVKLGTRFPEPGLSNVRGPLGGSGAPSLAENIASFTPGAGLTLGFFSGNDLRAIVRALASDTSSDILATPNIVTLDNEIATIKVGELVPFAIGESTESLDTGGTPFTSFEREEVGLSLTIRPQITPAGAIILHIDHILSNVLPGSALTNPGGNPTTSERVITTNVMVDNGEILVMGGLIQKEWEQTMDKVPFLGDLPMFGHLFRSQHRANVKKNLMIFLKPIVLRDSHSGIVVSGEKYEQIRQYQLDAIHGAKEPYISEPPVMPVVSDGYHLPSPFATSQKMPSPFNKHTSKRQG